MYEHHTEPGAVISNILKNKKEEWLRKRVLCISIFQLCLKTLPVFFSFSLSLSLSLYYIETTIFSLCRGGGGNMEDKKVWMSQLSFHSHTTHSHLHTYSARVGYHKIHTKKLFPCFFHFSEQNSLPRKHYQCLQVITAHAGIIQTVKNLKSDSPSFRTDKKNAHRGGDEVLCLLVFNLRLNRWRHACRCIGIQRFSTSGYEPKIVGRKEPPMYQENDAKIELCTSIGRVENSQIEHRVDSWIS